MGLLVGRSAKNNSLLPSALLRF